MFGNLGFTEILIILLVLVLLFGAKRIPEIGASIGKGLKEFKRGLKETSDEPGVERELKPPPATSSVPPSSSASTGGEPKRLSQ